MADDDEQGVAVPAAQSDWGVVPVGRAVEPVASTSTTDPVATAKVPSLAELSAQRWRDFEPPPLAKAAELEAAVRRIRAMTSAEIRALSVRAGIHDEDGNLTEHYRPATGGGGKRR